MSRTLRSEHLEELLAGLASINKNDDGTPFTVNRRCIAICRNLCAELELVALAPLSLFPRDDGSVNLAWTKVCGNIALTDYSLHLIAWSGATKDFSFPLLHIDDVAAFIREHEK